MSIFRTNDPTQYDDVDGVVIDERTPPANIRGVATNIVGMVLDIGTTGPENEIVEIGSSAELVEIFGATAKDHPDLKGKKFGPLKIVKPAKAAATPTDAEYSAAIDVFSAPGSCNILICDSQTAAVKAYLKTHVEDTQDKIAIICGAVGDDKAAVITDVATYRSDRLIYAFPYLKVADGSYVRPTGFYASVLAQIGPHIDPATVDAVPLLAGATGLKYPALSRADYISLMAAGVSSFELDSDFGIKIKSGITTQIADTAKVTVLRRRMADFLQDSAGRFLKTFQNKVNSRANRELAGAAIVGFVKNLQKDGVLPTDAELDGQGKVTLVDVKSANSPTSLAEGKFIIKWKQRIYSSMRYIVLVAEIGESVIVKDGE
jgi:fructose-specific component phosphotransferase system IIB-like protein